MKFPKLPVKNSLSEAYEAREKDVPEGFVITWKQIKELKILHGVAFLDKWNFLWKYEKEELYYKEPKDKFWGLGNIDGQDLPFKKFYILDAGIRKVTKKIESLKLKIEKLKITKEKQEKQDTEKYRRIGHGAAMRGYKCMTLNWNRPAETQKKIDILLKEISILEKISKREAI